MITKKKSIPTVEIKRERMLAMRYMCNRSKQLHKALKRFVNTRQINELNSAGNKMINLHDFIGLENGTEPLMTHVCTVRAAFHDDIDGAVFMQHMNRYPHS
jgi:hypothetical protein